MFCGHCGKEVEDTAAVCPWCGTILAEKKEETDESEEIERTELPEEEQGQEPEPPKEEKDKEPEPKPRKEKKARPLPPRQMAGIGISVPLLAAFLYWSGLIGETPVITVLLAGYVLLKEKDQWLRAVALKGLALVICFGLLLGGVDLLKYFKDMMTDIINMILSAVSLDAAAPTVTGEAFTDLLRILNYIVLLVRDLFLVLSGFAALRYKNISIPVIDDLVNRHFGKASGAE